MICLMGKFCESFVDMMGVLWWWCFEGNVARASARRRRRIVAR